MKELLLQHRIMPSTRRQGANKRKIKYDELHSSITTTNALEGDTIWHQSNLDSFSNISLPSPSSQQYDVHNSNNSNLSVRCYESPLPTHIHSQCINLFENNMKSLYENSSWGLDLDEKDSELSHDNARFLIVTFCSDDTCCSSSSSNYNNPSDRIIGNGGIDDNIGKEPKHEIVVAFTHFRFECSIDECNDHNYQYDNKAISNLPDFLIHDSILYVYEIQIDSRFQRQRLGKKLMTFMQRIAMKMKMKKVMLTVFKMNVKALSFYKNKLGYDVDESSPDDDDDDADYEILSKMVQG